MLRVIVLIEKHLITFSTFPYMADASVVSQISYGSIDKCII